jgi:hypothetical protein
MILVFRFSVQFGPASLSLFSPCRSALDGVGQHPSATPHALGLGWSEMAMTMPFPNRVSPFGETRPVKEDYRADLAIRLMCPNCKEEVPNIIEEYSSGDLICGTCGT